MDLMHVPVMNQGIIVKVHLPSSLSQVIDKFPGRVRNGIMLHDIPDILLDISARGDLDHPSSTSYFFRKILLKISMSALMFSTLS